MIDASELGPDTTAGMMRAHLSRAEDTLDRLLGAALIAMGAGNAGTSHVVDLAEKLNAHILGVFEALEGPDEDDDEPIPLIPTRSPCDVVCPTCRAPRGVACVEPGHTERDEASRNWIPPVPAKAKKTAARRSRRKAA